MQKDKDIDKDNLFLLVVPEKYKPIIFNTYHDSLVAGHQGPYRTAMTIRQKFFIHNLMNKIKRYIDACHTCLKMKPKYMKKGPVYGRIPVDYTPMQDLSINIKTMWQAFGGYHLLLVHNLRPNQFYNCSTTQRSNCSNGSRSIDIQSYILIWPTKTNPL